MSAPHEMHGLVDGIALQHNIFGSYLRPTLPQTPLHGQGQAGAAAPVKLPVQETVFCVQVTVVFLGLGPSDPHPTEGRVTEKGQGWPCPAKIKAGYGDGPPPKR